jgi:hypothetical protein
MGGRLIECPGGCGSTVNKGSDHCRTCGTCLSCHKNIHNGCTCLDKCPIAGNTPNVRERARHYRTCSDRRCKEKAKLAAELIAMIDKELKSGRTGRKVDVLPILKRMVESGI